MVDYGFAGGGNNTTTEMINGNTTVYGTTDSTHSESGSQHGTNYFHTNWVLDPDGTWRAAISHRIDSGLTSGQYESYLNESTVTDERQVHNTLQEQSAYHFNHDLTVATDINGQQTKSGSGSGGGTQSGTAIGLQLVHNPDSSHVINQTYHHYYDYHGSWNENYATGVATATANNDQTGSVVNEEIINGVLQEPPEPAYAVTSTSPGFKDGQIVNVALFGQSFDTKGSPGFGRTIPSATTQAPHKVIIPHEAYDPHKEAITTPQSVRNWQFALNLSAQVCFAVAGGLAGGGEAIAAEESTAGQGTQLYRVFGGEAKGLGQYYTTVNPGSLPNFRTAAGLFPGNSGQFVLEGTLNNTEGVIFRTAVPGPGGIGGGLPEVFVPNPQTQLNIFRVSGANPPF